eukprot:237965-Chlamydomonas_euryale.AAC.1
MCGATAPHKVIFKDGFFNHRTRLHAGRTGCRAKRVGLMARGGFCRPALLARDWTGMNSRCLDTHVRSYLNTHFRSYLPLEHPLHVHVCTYLHASLFCAPDCQLALSMPDDPSTAPPHKRSSPPSLR